MQENSASFNVLSETAQVNSSSTQGIPGIVDPERFNDLLSKFEDHQKYFEGYKTQLTKEIERLNTDKISLITVLGIFVSVFTFVSVEIQVLRYICNFYQVLGLTFIIPGILIIFNCSLDYVARSWISNSKNESWYKVTLVAAVGFVLIALGMDFISKTTPNLTCIL